LSVQEVSPAYTSIISLNPKVKLLSFKTLKISAAQISAANLLNPLENQESKNKVAVWRLTFGPSGLRAL
jgi:hypothetical protein